MDLGPHAAFIIVAYVAASAVVLALVAWIAADYHRQLKILRDLETQGVTRRSAQPMDRTS